MSTLRRSIGQLAAEIGLNSSALRFYETEGLLQPDDRTASGYRVYGARAEHRLRFLKRAQSLGLTLAEIKLLSNRLAPGETSKPRRFEVRWHRRSPRLGRVSLGCAQSLASWSGWRRSWSTMLLPIAVTLAIALVGFLNQTSNYGRHVPRYVISLLRTIAAGRIVPSRRSQMP